MLAEEQQGGSLEPSETLPDNKAASFARAFAKIIESGDSGRGLLQAGFSPVRTTHTFSLPGSPEMNSQSRADFLIVALEEPQSEWNMSMLLAESQYGMQGSKSLSKRKREVDAEEQGEREARQLRREMRMRGHVVRCLQHLTS